MKNFSLLLALAVPALALADSTAGHWHDPAQFIEPEHGWENSEPQPQSVEVWLADDDEDGRRESKKEKTVVTPEPDAVYLLLSATMAGMPFVLRRKRKF